jgi:hypothetical protein
MDTRNGQKKSTFFARVHIMLQTGPKHEKLSDTQICNLFVREVDSDTPLDHIQGSRSIRMMGAHLRTRFHEDEDNAETGGLGKRLRAAAGLFSPRWSGFKFRDLVPHVLGDHCSR